VFGGVDGTAALYPLPLNFMSPSTSTYNGTVVAGGSSFYAFTVPAEGTATLTLSGQAGATGSSLQLVIVRTR
jgi:hypothetical protein